MTSTIETEDVVERLNDEAMRLQGRGIDRGCVDSSLAGNLAIEAADTIERLREENARVVLERDRWKAECKALCDVVSEHTRARAALNQQ